MLKRITDRNMIEKGWSDEKSGGLNLKTETGFKKPIITVKNPDSLAAEQYRVLYTRLEQISQRKSYKTFAITSALKGEGKTITTLNLAYIMALEFRKKVILVECDFKNPYITSHFMDTMPEHGLIDVIEGKADLSTAIVRYKHSEFHILPAGRIARNSLELLGSNRINFIINMLKSQYDYVIVDSPPISPIADMNVISKAVDGLVLVVEAGKTPKDIVLRAVNSLDNVDIAGIVLNGADNYLLNEYYY